MIYNVTPEDAGDYRCVMGNHTGAIASDYKSVAVKGYYIIIIMHITYNIHIVLLLQ